MKKLISSPQKTFDSLSKLSPFGRKQARRENLGSSGASQPQARPPVSNAHQQYASQSDGLRFNPLAGRGTIVQPVAPLRDVPGKQRAPYANGSDRPAREWGEVWQELLRPAEQKRVGAANREASHVGSRLVVDEIPDRASELWNEELNSMLRQTRRSHRAGQTRVQEEFETDLHPAARGRFGAGAGAWPAVPEGRHWSVVPSTELDSGVGPLERIDSYTPGFDQVHFETAPSEGIDYQNAAAGEIDYKPVRRNEIEQERPLARDPFESALPEDLDYGLSEPIGLETAPAGGDYEAPFDEFGFEPAYQDELEFEPPPTRGAFGSADLPIAEDRVVEGGEQDREPASPSKILIVDRKGELSVELVKVAADLQPAPIVLRLNRPTQLVEVVEQERPDVIVLAPPEMTKAGLRRVADVRRTDPRMVIVLSDNDKPLSAAQAAETGASGILPARPTRQKLRTMLTRAVQTAERLRSEEPDRRLDKVESSRSEELGRPNEETEAFYGNGVLATWSHDELPESDWVFDEPLSPDYSPAPKFEPPMLVPPRFEEPAMTPAEAVDYEPSPVIDTGGTVTARTTQARVFTVASASGGTGKTFLATNLATYLVKATGSKVLLLDLALQFGEVGVALHLRPQRTLAELLQEDDLVSALPDYLEEDRSGFKVLCAPSDPLEGEKIGAAEVKAVLDAALGEFDFIVVDTLSTLNETSLVAFDESEVLLLVANMDLPSLKHMRTFMQTLEQLQTGAEKVSLILNRAQSGGGIELAEVEEIYPEKFLTVLPDAKEVLHSINSGVPVLQGNPSAAISRQLAEAFVKLVPPQEGVGLPWIEQGASKNRFVRFFRGR